MDNATALEVLLWTSVILSLVLLLISTMAVGKQIADLQYQIIKRINGIRRVQSWINFRTHLNRVLFGSTFFVASVLVIIDAPELMRTWIARISLVGVLLALTISAILDWIAENKQLRILSSHEEVNHISRMRHNMHALNNKLTEYYGFLELLDVNNDNLDRLRDEIETLVDDVQIDLHDMDVSYLPEKENLNADAKN